jgi:hypothetical protein
MLGNSLSSCTIGGFSRRALLHDWAKQPLECPKISFESNKKIKNLLVSTCSLYRSWCV